MEVKLNNKYLDYSSTHIVLEAGPTHYGVDSAKKLIYQAKKAGADSIKFQTLGATEKLMADLSFPFTYDILERINDKEKFVEITEPLSDIFIRRELTNDQWREIKNYCDEVGIHMFTTVCFEDDVDFLVDELGIDSIKICSADVNMLGFIKYVAKKGVNVQLDTGNSDLWEIEKAVIAIEEEGNKNIIIHHCPSGYPAKLPSINLKMLNTLKSLFPNYLIAFSDHTPGWEMDIAAVALGAGMVEKTITLDRTIKSCEHSMSLEGDQIKNFVKSIKNLEVALGESRRVLPSKVKGQKRINRRSPYANKNLKSGDVIKKDDFIFRRPAYGVTYEEFENILGKKLTSNLNKSEVLKNNNI
jgi:sialic acid synthase SpsE